MNQDQGKPSDRLFEAEKHGVFNPVVKGLFDELHQRLVSAEAEIMNLNMRKLPHPDWLKQLELRVANLEIASIKSPTQEATKPECNKCNGTKMVASIPWGGEYQINPCPVCVPIPTPEPEANKPECEHDKGDKWSCLDKYTYIIAYPKTGFPKCPICNAIPTPESGKLAEIIFRLEYPIEKYSLPYKECGYGIHEKYYKIAEAAVKEFERFLDCYFKDERKFDIGFLKKKLREYLL